MSSRIDPATFDRLAIAAMRERLAKLSVGDLDRPSACAGWSIRQLLSHLVGGNLRFALALDGEAPDWASRDEEAVGSPLAEFDESAAQMTATIGQIDDPNRPALLPAGAPPAGFAVSVHATDMLVHGWDVAVSTGQDATLDPTLCRLAIAVIEKYPSSFWGDGQFFAERIAISSDDPQARLLALTGRDPHRP